MKLIIGYEVQYSIVDCLYAEVEVSVGTFLANPFFSASDLGPADAEFKEVKK
jgi:hypothetical protein